VKKPNLCIVTEFMKQGSLKDILANHAIKLTWKQKLRLLHGVSLGINYLHSLHPVIVHRDLKPSNLLVRPLRCPCASSPASAAHHLTHGIRNIRYTKRSQVDENWNVKVADFGFARIKEENATMTHCGTPCWTAPEILRGEKYDERADVFSFGIIMWQVVTRKDPYAGRNFMGVSLDVLEGKRPNAMPDLPAAFQKTMSRCWHAKPGKRPPMSTVVEVFADLLGDDPLAGAT
jgi:serine/threonine protein kinase